MEQVSTKASHRETMVTLPQVSAEAYASVSEAVSDGLGELVSTELDWAVDTEPMRAMTTFDLWMALATGDLQGDVRVWKLGRERWQPAHEVPELACALNLQRPELFALAAEIAGAEDAGTGAAAAESAVAVGSTLAGGSAAAVASTVVAEVAALGVAEPGVDVDADVVATAAVADAHVVAVAGADVLAASDGVGGRESFDETPPATVTDIDADDDDVELLTPAAPAVAIVHAARSSTVRVSMPAVSSVAPMALSMRAASARRGRAASEKPSEKTRRSRVRNAVASAVAVAVTVFFAVASPSTEHRARAAARPLLMGEATVLSARTLFDSIAARADALAALPAPQAPAASQRPAADRPAAEQGADAERAVAERAEPRKKKRVVAKPKGQKRVSRTGKETRGARGAKPAR